MTQRLTRTARGLDKALRKVGGLPEFVTARRGAGDSWEQVAFAVQSRTGQPVAASSLRNWFAAAPATDDGPDEKAA